MKEDEDEERRKMRRKWLREKMLRGRKVGFGEPGEDKEDGRR